jgi:hypothetical protein
MTQPVAEYSLDLSGLADPVGLALSVGQQTYRVIGMQPGRNGDLSISRRTRCGTCGPAL